MIIRICDKCKQKITVCNRVHVYNYIVRNKTEKKCIKPRRDDFDLCIICRKKLIEWINKND